MCGTPLIRMRHGSSAEVMSRSASIVTGLRAASAPPASRIGSKEIAARPVEMVYSVELSRDAVNWPSLSVIFVSVLTWTGAPAIGVFRIISLNVTSVTGGVGVAVGVSVAVLVIVGVGVTVGVVVSVGVAVGVEVSVDVGVTLGELVAVCVGVCVDVAVAVFVGVCVGVLVGLDVGV